MTAPIIIVTPITITMDSSGITEERGEQYQLHQNKRGKIRVSKYTQRLPDYLPHRSNGKQCLKRKNKAKAKNKVIC